MIVDFDEQATVAMLEELGQLGVDIAAVERPWRAVGAAEVAAIAPHDRRAGPARQSRLGVAYRLTSIDLLQTGVSFVAVIRELLSWVSKK